MPEMRKLIRKPHLSLQQIYKRLCEKDFNTAIVDDDTGIQFTQPHAEGPLLGDFPANVWHQFHNLQVGKFRYATSLRDSYCALEDSRICLIKNIINYGDQTFFIVQHFRTALPVYNIGITSDVAGVFNCSNLSRRLEAVNIKDVKSKVYRMPKWSSANGREEVVIENNWICVLFLSTIVWPGN
ncbi:uncharacterized protein LOC127286356 [Leptopilina boulardi]|uniref:uncharacterized protein LOC127286356 n=1 Tax=Leptopilina boulardi TaxID=63433 RepID=UPI0021F52F48|nr:uncharacterized protein LOC127286356 [Leptopilina boulardi]XP_051168715.1 uncharacterized protein LOC127286356 [Leptopilina boulardi]